MLRYLTLVNLEPTNLQYPIYYHTDLRLSKILNYVTSGYNWGSVSSEAQSEEETFEVTATAPAGTSVFFEQVYILM